MLLLDIGGVVLRSAHEAMAGLADDPALARFAARRGRLGPAPDPAWEDTLAGRASERGYWADRAAEAGALVGGAGDVPWLMGLLYGHADDDFRPDAVALMDDAHAAGHVVAALTNDLAAFHGDADLTRDPVLARFDVVVDGSVTGVLKPDPGAYAIALDRLGRAASEVVFLDDMPANAAGGRAAGLRVVEVDLTDPAPAFARARELLGLAPARARGAA